MRRIVSMSGFEPMARGSQGPWRIDTDRLLKTTVKHKPIRTLDKAQALFDTYRTAHEAAPWTPKPFEVVQTPNGYRIVVEYVHGDKILPYIVLGILTPEDVGFGHPATDLANARSHILFNYNSSPMALRIWNTLHTRRNHTTTPTLRAVQSAHAMPQKTRMPPSIFPCWIGCMGQIAIINAL